MSDKLKVLTCWWYWWCQPCGGTIGNIMRSPKSVGFILWVPLISVENSSAIRPIVVEIFHSGQMCWTDQQTDAPIEPSHYCSYKMVWVTLVLFGLFLLSQSTFLFICCFHGFVRNAPGSNGCLVHPLLADISQYFNSLQWAWLGMRFCRPITFQMFEKMNDRSAHGLALPDTLVMSQRKTFNKEAKSVTLHQWQKTRSTGRSLLTYKASVFTTVSILLR